VNRSKILIIVFSFMLKSCEFFERFLKNLEHNNPVDPNYEGEKGILHGVVKSLSGESTHSGIQVVIRDYRYPDIPFLVTTQTSNDGTFSYSLPPSKYRIILSNNKIQIGKWYLVDIFANKITEVQLNFPYEKLLPSNYTGETGILTGKVTKVGAPIVAEVSVGEWLTVSDVDGSYLIKVPTRTYTIIARRIEFDIIWMTGRKQP